MRFFRAFLFFALPLAAAATPAQQAVRLATIPMDPPEGLKRATRLGAMDAGAKLHISVTLPYRDEAGLQRFVDSVSDPKSPNYRHFLTPEQVGQQFGLPAASVKSVSDYLTSQGMTIRLVSKNHTTILADCTVGQAQAAFHTKIALFQSPEINLRPGQTLFSYTSSPSVPAQIAPLIRYIGGLDTFTRGKGGQYVTPDQLRVLYSVAPSYSGGFQGKQRTIAISSYDGFELSNVPLEYAHFSLPAPTGGVGSNITVVTVDPGEGGENGPQTGEGDLDIQCALAMAPVCKLLVYDGGNLGGNFWDPVGTLAKEADDNLADIVSESYLWSGGSGFYASLHSSHLAMNAQGMTYMACAGDHGAPGLATYPYPSMDPEVLSVGGTTITTDTKGDRVTETAWSLTDELGDGTLWGGGGGWYPSLDAFNVVPPYEKGAGMPTGIPYRMLPDISLDADFSYEIYLNGVFQPTLGYAWGGTSCATPTFAGSLADVEERLIAAGALQPLPGTSLYRLGRLQDLLYSLAGNSKVFYDVTTGGIGQLPNGAEATAKAGWDFATGIGVVNFDGLYTAMATEPTVKAVTVSPAAIEGGSSTTITGAVTLSGPTAIPGYTVILSTSNASAARISPSSVVVPLGQTSATFAITTSSVSASTPVTIKAAWSASSATTTLTVTPPKLSSVSLASSSVAGGASLSGTVTLDAPAGTGGVAVSLTSSDPTFVTVPAKVVVPAASKSFAFSVATKSVLATTKVVITASANGGSGSATLTLNPVSVSGVTLSATSLYATGQATGTVTLTAPAPASGSVVTLTLSNASAASLSATSVKIAAGGTKGTFSLTAKGVNAATTETVTAACGGATKTASVTIQPAILSAVTSSSTTALGGVNNPSIKFTLNAPAGPAGTTITLSATPSSAASFSSATVKVPAGATSVSATLTTVGVAKKTTVTVKGLAGVAKTVTVTVTPAVLTGFTISPASIQGNGTKAVTGTLTLNGPTGPAARTVTLTSTSSAAGLPGSVSVPAGKKTVTFTFKPLAVTKTTTCTLTAKLVSASLTQTLTITH